MLSTGGSASPSLSDRSSLVSPGLEDAGHFELFPDLEFSGGFARQVSSESTKTDPADVLDGVNKQRLMAVKIDPSQDQELLEFLTGVSHSDEENVESILEDPSAILRSPARRVVENRQIRSVVSVNGYRDVTFGEHEGKCMSKNAVAARENRLRKKQYVRDMEQTVSSLKAENSTLKSQVSTMQEAVSDLKTEVKYLRNVLANQSTLAALLKNIPSASGVNLVAKVSHSPQPTNRRKRALEAEDKSDEESDTVFSGKQNGRDTERKNSEAPVTHVGVPLGGVHTRSKQSKVPKLDHCYATNNPAVTQFQKRQQLKARPQQSSSSADEDAGVCLHVSGKRVSLEFCAQCSRRASDDERFS